MVLAVTDETPRVLVVRRMEHGLATPAQRGSPVTSRDSADALPFGPFDPARHRTLDLGTRQWVEEQTGLELRYVEQLYTFGNQYRDTREVEGGPRLVSVAYLALTHEAPVAGSGDAAWRDWYAFLPWEDRRDGPSSLVEKVIRPALVRWVKAAESTTERRARQTRVKICFGSKSLPSYDGVHSLERYELLYEAGLVPEAHRDSQVSPAAGSSALPAPDPASWEAAQRLGPPMALDNRRILATALGRMRGKLAYRPVVFELLPEAFTLLQLQRVVEALAGTRLHKQNFRRMLTAGELVEPTGDMDSSGKGRPAARYRFRHAVTSERAKVGVTLPTLSAD